jgi:hypothetical protein
METKYKLGIQSQWYNNEKTLIYTEISGAWDWEDVQGNLVNLLQMAQSVNYPLGLMILLPDNLSIPPTGFAQASRHAMNTHAEAEFHTVVYVTENYSLKTLWEETISTYAHDASRYHVVDSVEEALELLAASS